jgi:3-isopropylmalate/(R)-2-methylmalate dehydratase small subunit
MQGSSAGPARIRTVEGRGIPLRGDSIDTDRIMPARYLRCVTFDGIEAHVFEDDRRASGAKPHAFDVPAYRGAGVLVANSNFGCGSSREPAPQGLQRWGSRALVAESFAEIFAGNCLALGLPCLVVSAAGAAAIQSALEEDPETLVRVDVESPGVTLRGRNGAPRRFEARIPAGVRHSLIEGTWDATAVLLEDPSAIDRVAGALPYLRGFAG